MLQLRDRLSPLPGQKEIDRSAQRNITDRPQFLPQFAWQQTDCDSMIHIDPGAESAGESGISVAGLQSQKPR